MTHPPPSGYTFGRAKVRDLPPTLTVSPVTHLKNNTMKYILNIQQAKNMRRATRLFELVYGKRPFVQIKSKQS